MGFVLHIWEKILVKHETKLVPRLSNEGGIEYTLGGSMQLSSESETEGKI